MEVEASAIANCTTEFYSPPVGQMPALELVSRPAVEDPEATPTRLSVEKPQEDNTKVESIQAQENHVPEPPTVPKAPSTTGASANNNVGKYRLIRTIGKGNFAKVKLAIHMATGAEVAIKIINKTLMDSTLLKRLRREITIMKITNHPNIVRLLEIIENEDVLCLVMEYASGGEIFDYLVANGKMREKEARIKFRQLLSAIQYCHSKRIVHRDLKAENILLDRNLNVKVADFGLANTFDYDQRLNTFCGSPPYAAPELFLGIPYYGPGVDVWSLGVILFTLVLGHLPFDARDLRELRSKIIGLNYTIPKGSVSPECEALLRKMLVLDPKDRSSLKLLMQDKWINMGYPPNEILRPFKEPPRSQLDEVRVKAMETMGFTRADLESSVINPEFDHVYATYHLLPETPSQFVVLCEEFAKQPPIQTQAALTLPNALLNTQTSPPPQIKPSTEPDKPTVEIGRFTVAPSGNIVEPSTKTPVPKSTVPVSESGQREHHSLTSSLPVALKRAFVQMGQVFGGGGSTHTSVTTGHSVEVNPRNATHPHSARSSTKPPKQDGGRSAVTAAPVPIISSKKSHPTPHSKRASPHGPLPTPPGSVARTVSTDSTSTTNTATASRGTPSTPTAQFTLVTAAAPISSKLESARKKAQKPLSGTSTPRSSAVKQRDNTTSEVSRKTPPSDKPVIPRAAPDVTDGEAHLESKSIASSSTSSDSYAETPIRKKSTSSVQDVWLAAKKSEKILSSPPTPLNSEAIATQPGDPPVKSVAFEVDTIAQAVSARIAVDTPSPSGRWSPDGERLSTKSASPPQPKASHTIQGNEAKVMLEEALRAQQSASESAPNPSPSDTGNYAIDPSHSNTWSRGVFKALGGFFAPNKPTDHRSHGAISNASVLTGPREVRFPWSVHTTSTKTANDVLKEIITALEVTPGCRYAYDPHLPYLLRCSWAADRGSLRTDTSAATNAAGTPQSEGPPSAPVFGVPHHCGLREDPVHWEMEVCQLPRLHLRGVRVKRIRGSALQFRPIADLVMKSLHL